MGYRCKREMMKRTLFIIAFSAALTAPTISPHAQTVHRSAPSINPLSRQVINPIVISNLIASQREEQLGRIRELLEKLCQQRPFHHCAPPASP
jgi:hypothetical protein